MANIKNRGFASMSPERRKEIAGLGGKTVQQKGTGHKFTSAEAVTAGRRGGNARSKKVQGRNNTSKKQKAGKP